MNKTTKPTLKERMSKISKPMLAMAGISVLAIGFGITAMASADSLAPTASTTNLTTMQNHQRPAVFGKVTAVSGTTLTVTSTNRKTSTTTTYTVDASSATVMKATAPAVGTAPTAPTSVTVSDIAVGDTVAISGTVSGTNVTATSIMDGVMMGGHGQRGFGGHAYGVGGTISAINGSTITVTGKNGTTYTVNAGSANVEKVSASSFADLAVGDTIVANGTVSGTTVTATRIMDGVPTSTQ